MEFTLNPTSIEDYKLFLKIKSLPAWSIQGRLATVPDEYAAALTETAVTEQPKEIAAHPQAFDYQRDITELAIRKKQFAVFADCGLGKTLIEISFAVHALHATGKRILILTPPLVIDQMLGEAAKFYPGEQFERVKASELNEWLSSDKPGIGITNYEALKRDTPRGNLAGLVLDESSILKSHYGQYATICLRLGKGVEWKLCATGTPAPNDRIEYANHAVFLDRFPTVNSFLAKYFVNRGQTDNRWELKPHALRPFYRSLSDWCIFLTNPATYGWKDNCGTLPPINTHIHDVPLTRQQKQWVNRELGQLIATRAGGITARASYGQVSKGHYKGQDFETNKPGYIADLVNGWRANDATLLWCIYDHEQKLIHDAVGGDSLDGKTPLANRRDAIQRFQSGETDALTSKSRILGFGLNLQKATRQVFSGLQDSYESYYQCVKRSNRIGSTKPLNVHIPVTELEYPMVDNVIRKSDRVEQDTREQEEMFAAAKVL